MWAFSFKFSTNSLLHMVICGNELKRIRDQELSTQDLSKLLFLLEKVDRRSIDSL